MAGEGCAGGAERQTLGFIQGTHMRRKTILHALNTPAAYPLMSSARARGRTIHTAKPQRATDVH
jgi:hypothetical protein